MRVGLLTLVATTAHALRPSLMLLPGASTGRITEDEARQRTSWPHWKPDEEKSPAVAPPPPATTPQKAWRRESDWTTDEEEPAVPPSPPTKPQAYTLAAKEEKHIKANIKVSSTETGIVFGSIVYDGNDTNGAKEQNADRDRIACGRMIVGRR